MPDDPTPTPPTDDNHDGDASSSSSSKRRRSPAARKRSGSRPPSPSSSRSLFDDADADDANGGGWAVGPNRVVPTDEDEGASTAPAEGEASAGRKQLRDIYFRHREAVRDGRARPLDEREADRQVVGDIYPTLSPGTDRMLDVRTLGVLVDSHVQSQKQALASLVSPPERMAMLAVIVRRNSFPVVTLPPVSTLALAPLLGRGPSSPSITDSVSPSEVNAEADAARAEDLPPTPTATGRIAVRAIDPTVVEAAKNRMRERLIAGLSPTEWAALNADETQLVSLVASAQDWLLRREPDGTMRAIPRETPSSAINIDAADDDDGPDDNDDDALPSSHHFGSTPGHRPVAMTRGFRNTGEPIAASDETTAAAPAKKRRRRRSASPPDDTAEEEA